MTKDDLPTKSQIRKELYEAIMYGPANKLKERLEAVLDRYFKEY